MKRWRLGLAGCFLVFMASGINVSAETATDERPNIILIVSDDQGYADLSPSAAPDITTPGLERLGNSGMRFTQAYVTAPICNASRLGLMTGMYQQRLGTYWYDSKGIQDAATLAEVLKKQGYVSGYVGKVHYGKGDDPQHRDFPLNHGFDYFYGFFGGHKHYLIHNDAEEEQFKAKARQHGREERTLAMGAMWENREKVDEQGFSTELFGQKARDFIDRNRKRPFFLQLSFNAVHCFTHQLPKRYLAEKGIKGGSDWDPARETMVDWDPANHTDPDDGRALMLGQLHFMDREIGRLLDHLKNQGLRDNTLIVFLSDNGGSKPIFADNTPLRGGKYTLFEGGVRVPMVVSWPRAVAQGKVVENIVSSLDLFPTFAALAGADVPSSLDGMDLSPLLLGENPHLHHDALFWDTGKGLAVRQGNWKLRIAGAQEGFTFSLVDNEPGEYLFNLKDDAGETKNLKDKHPGTFSELRSLHAAWKARLNSSEVPGWELVWSDEFDYEGLPDPSKWGYEEGLIRNEEPQYYTRGRLENTRVEDGMLVIEGRKEKIQNARYNPDSTDWQRNRESAEYTSGSINTLNKACWKYGRMESRAKVPAGSGAWPAFWMMGINRIPPTAEPEAGKVPWPFCGEIDIMEFIGKEPNTTHVAAHFPNPETGKPRARGKHMKVGAPPSDAFHIYAVEWSPDRIDYFYDDHLFYSVSVDVAGEGADNPFRKPHYILLNLALGQWGGEIDETLLPQQFRVDYVRVYKLKGQP